jgi:CHAT domain-containing protein
MLTTCDSPTPRCTSHVRGVQQKWQSLVCLLLFLLLCLRINAAAQSKNPPTQPTQFTVPAELTAVDPDIRALLKGEYNSCKYQSSNERLERIQKALQIADDRGLTRDRALVEAFLGSALISEGKSELAFLTFEKAFQDSIDSKNEILEADILNALASQAELRGNNQKSLELLSRALTLADKNGSLYEKARALGATGRLQFLTGNTTEAQKSISEALNIDKLNGYKFEALHLVYQSYLLLLSGRNDQAMDLLSQARSKAIEVNDANAFLTAENAYGVYLVRTGRPDDAITELELLRKADFETLALKSDEQHCLAVQLTLPLSRLNLLEGLSNVLEIADRREREIEIWREVLSTCHEVGLLAGEAEAQHKIADLENQLKRTDDALKDYAIALELYRKLQNESQLARVEVSEALLFIKVGRGKEAVSLEQEVASYAERQHLRGPEFAAYGVMAEIYQPAGDFEGARDASEKALSLVIPGPFDDELDNKSVLEDYLFLADDYKALKNPPKELIAIDNAYFVAVHLKDEKVQQHLVAYLDQRIKDLSIRALVGERQRDDKLSESLVYSYVLLIRDGFPSKPTDDQSNWQRILSLPFQITRQARGASSLEEILHDIGPIVGINKMPILSALARYYINDGSNPVLAEKYAIEADAVVKDAKGDMTPFRAENACTLALSYSRQGKKIIAKDKIEECLTLSRKTGDEQAINYSDAANVLVQTQLGNIAAARDSLEKFAAKAPNEPKMNLQLAMALDGAKLYDEAGAQLDVAMKKFISAGDKETAAIAYTSVAGVLNSDPSEKAQALQLQYLKSARQLYRTLEGRAGEAEVLLLLGDYFLKVVQPKAAIDSYEEALGLARTISRPDIEARAEFGLGVGFNAQHEFDRAVEYQRKAVTAFHNLNNSVLEAIALENLAGDYSEIGDTKTALSSLLEAKKLTKTVPALNQYFADYYLGDFYRSQGQYEKALAAFNEAVEVTNQADDLEHLGYSHLAIAGLHTVIGSWDEALSESKTALDLFQQIGNKAGQADCWSLLTGIYCDRTSSLKNFEKAKECYAKAKELGYGQTLQLDLLEIYLQTGRYSEATTIASESLRDCQKTKNTNCQANALISIAEAEGLNGDLIRARSALNQARPIASKLSEIYLQGRLLYAEGRLLVLEGNLHDALTTYKKLVQLIETVKGNLSPQEQKSISENYGYIYDELVSVLYSLSARGDSHQSEFATEALKYAEINKSRQFAATWGRVFVNQMRITLPPGIQEREQSVYSKRDRLLAQLEANLDSRAAGQAQKKRLESELLSTEAEMKALLIDLRKVSPSYAAIAYPEEVQLFALPLRIGETFVEFKMTDDCTFVWIIQNKDGSKNHLVSFYKIPKKRDWFLQQFSAIRDQLNSGRPGTVDWRKSEDLFSQLFPGEIAELIANSQEVIFVPDDILFVLPFEIFSPEASKGNFLLLNKSTAYYPSAVSFRLARTASHQANWREAFLGIADPITSPEDDRFEAVAVLNSAAITYSRQEQNPQDRKNSEAANKLKARGFTFERIPATATEVQDISSLMRATGESVDVRYGASATKSQLLDTDLSKFRFVHFATHGVLPVDTGINEPSLVLSYDGIASSHMFLSMSEILGLKLRSESVVLSACNTGSGKISRAEGVMSLGRAFLAAGSASVTVSLWQVSDESTALLMKKYYEGVLSGKRKNVALAEARSAVYGSGAKDPLFWAPFILIGE